MVAHGNTQGRTSASRDARATMEAEGENKDCVKMHPVASLKILCKTGSLGCPNSEFAYACEILDTRGINLDNSPENAISRCPTWKEMLGSEVHRNRICTQII